VAELPPYTIREYEDGDEHAILATFNRVFAEADPSFVPRTLEQWRWQYLENPSGWRISLAVLDGDGSVISQYAGVGQRMLLEGQPANFSQAVDSMTDPAWRRGLKKPGFFVLTGYPYAAGYGGPPPDQDTIMWGLPVPPAWRVGKTYLDYELVRTQLKLVADPARLVLGDASGVDIEEVDEFPEEVAALAERRAGAAGAMAIRDKAQLDWRFVRHPEKSYKIALARRAGALVGCSVFATGAFDLSEDALVCDWIVDVGDTAAANALLAWQAQHARAAGMQRLTTILPETCPEWLAFQRAGFRVRPTHYFLVGRNYVKRYSMIWLYHNWFYTLGDTDLC